MFSGICGANKHPTAVEFLRRLRILLIGGWTAEVMVIGSSVEIENKRYLDRYTPDEKFPMVTEKIAKANGVNSKAVTISKALLDGPVDPDAEEISILLDCDLYRATDCNFQGLTYVAGFIASKFKHKYPELGTKTKEVLQKSSINSWIMRISDGGLIAPSEKFLRSIIEFEKEFRLFHKITHWKSINRDAWVIDRFAQQLEKKFGDIYDKKIYALFAKTRTHIRIKQINIKQKEFDDKERAKKGLKRKKSVREYKQLGQFVN